MTRVYVYENIVQHDNNKWECCGAWTYAPNLESAVGRLLAKLIKEK